MTKQTLKTKSAKLGHTLSRFQVRKSMIPQEQDKILYYVAWCTKCDAAAFTTDAEDSPALKRECKDSIY